MLWGRVAIIGVGLIGGSLAAAIRRRSLAGEVVGYGRDPRSLEVAIGRGLIDRATSDLPAAVRDADLIVVCVPVDRIGPLLCEMAPLAATGTILTDVGSTKASIIRQVEGRLPRQVEWVPAHPLAGSERAGAEFADPELFNGRLTILTPLSDNKPAAVEAVAELWRRVGAETVCMDAVEHDRIMGMVSHLPHAAAAALAACTPPQVLRYAASGYRDTTRVAAGDPRLWTAIFLANRQALLSALDAYTEQLQQLRHILQANDEQALYSWLTQAKQVRDALGSRDPAART